MEQNRTIENSIAESLNTKKMKAALVLIHCLLKEINPLSFELAMSQFEQLKPKDISIKEWMEMRSSIMKYQDDLGIQNKLPPNFF